MAKILWQKEVDARRDLALAVMRLCDAPDAMYELFVPSVSVKDGGPAAKRWRTDWCQSESDAITLLRRARESLERYVACDPDGHSVLSRRLGPKWKFGHRDDRDHTVLSLACAGPQAADYVRNEPVLLGACVIGCMHAYDGDNYSWPSVGLSYTIAALRMLRLWLSTRSQDLSHEASDLSYVRVSILVGWKRSVEMAIEQHGYNGRGAPLVDLHRYYSKNSLEQIYTRGCSLRREQVSIDVAETRAYPNCFNDNWHLLGRSCFNWVDAAIGAGRIYTTPQGYRQLDLDVWHEPGPCGVAWLDAIVDNPPAPGARNSHTLVGRYVP